MRIFIWFLFYIFIIVQPVHALNNIEIEDAWISEAPPTVKILAGYFTIVNHTEDPVDLISAQSQAFERIEFHLSKTRDGVAHMQKQESTTIPAKSEFSFTPGAYHLMLFNPMQALNSGDFVQLQLVFSNGDSIDIKAEVKRGDHSGHHNH